MTHDTMETVGVNEPALRAAVEIAERAGRGERCMCRAGLRRPLEQCPSSVQTIVARHFVAMTLRRRLWLALFPGTA